MNKFITETFQIWCKNSHHCHVQVKKIVMMFTEVFALVPLSTGVPLSVSTVKNLPANARDVGSISGSGRSPGGGHGNPLQYLAWRIPWTEEPGGLQAMGSQRVGHN